MKKFKKNIFSAKYCSKDKHMKEQREKENIENILKNKKNNLVKQIKNDQLLIIDVKKEIEQEYEGKEITVLKQKDFDSGIYRIKTPGKYELGEDITFDAENALDLVCSSSGVATCPIMCGATPAAKAAHGELSMSHTLGQFAAIAIEADGVILDMGGYRIAQSKRHWIRQRFFSAIELNDQPFPTDQGPAKFGDELVSASRTIIRNGTIGLTSHYGIHGNNNSYIYVEHVNFIDFEVGAIAINKCDNLSIQNCVIDGSNFEMPLESAFSHAVFANQFLDRTLAVNCPSQTSEQVEIYKKIEIDKNILKDDVDIAEQQVIDELPGGVSNVFFQNPGKEGTCTRQGINIHGAGVAVNSLGDSQILKSRSYNVNIENVTIQDITSSPRDSLILFDSVKNIPIRGVAGDVVDFFKVMDPNTGWCRSNNNLLMLYAQLQRATSTVEDREDYVGTLHFPSFMSEWVMNGVIVEEVLEKKCDPLSARKKIFHDIREYVNHKRGELKWMTNGDSMFHVSKGVIGARLDGIVGLKMSNFKISGVRSKSVESPKGFFTPSLLLPCEKNYMIQHPLTALANPSDHLECILLLLSCIFWVDVENVKLTNAQSDVGDSCGLRIIEKDCELCHSIQKIESDMVDRKIMP